MANRINRFKIFFNYMKKRNIIILFKLKLKFYYRSSRDVYTNVSMVTQIILVIFFSKSITDTTF